MKKPRVAVNGYGTIGMRVADAVLKQKDMILVGVTKNRPDFRCRQAREKGMDVYSIGSGEEFREAGHEVAGNLKDLLSKADVVIDCAPKKEGRKNLQTYRQFPNLKAIFQGGESHDISEVSFNSHANYDKAKGKKFVRVVSCNTTALCRVITQLNEKYPIKKARVAIARRSVDPGAGSRKVSVNAWQPSMSYPSHHAIDVGRVIPGIKISSLAGIAPMTLMHGHMVFVEFEKAPTSAEDAIEHLSLNPRIRTVSSDDGFASTAQIKDYAESNGREGNIYEVCLWKEGAGTDPEGELGMHLAIDQQAVVIPENIDAVRAMFEMADAEESMAVTNRSLGIGKNQQALRHSEPLQTRTRS